MNILYLIGNGFDLNAGAKTSTEDFYKSIPDYLKMNRYPEYNEAVNDIYTMIEKDKDNWSNYEEALGRYGDNCKNIEKYKDTLIGMTYAFHDFISKEEKIISGSPLNEPAGTNFYLDLMSILKDGYLSQDANNGKSLNNEDKEIVINIVTFNYTSLIDRIVDLTLKANPHINSQRLISNHLLRLTSPVHIHGKIESNSPIIIGVDNLKQISNNEYAKDDELRELLLKPEMRNMTNKQDTQLFESYIDNANIIVIYGMSLGLTDKCWWEKIGHWLAASSMYEKKLIIHENKKVDSSIIIVPSKLHKFIEEKKDNFIKIADIKNESAIVAKDRLIFSFCSDVFNDVKINISD